MRARAGFVATLLLALATLLLPAALRAQDLQPVPELKARVTDTSGTLSASQRQALEQQLATFEREAGTQMVVLVVPTTQPEDIAAYAFRVADTWKIGRKGVGDGLLILVAMQDRRFRIEVARDLEGAIPDLAASRVIDNALRPAFRRGDYAGGLSAAIDQLAALVRGEALPAPDPKARKRKGGIGLEELAMFFFIGVPVIGAVFTGVLGRKLGSVATGGAAGVIAWFVGASLLLAGVAGVVAVVLVGVMGIGAAGRRGGGVPIIWGGGGGGGGGGGWGRGGGGGGGFSSGGGGSFGGGGASGGW
jgi:uncharacterized protein